jgi:branched-chain amino acid transport system permease protein
MMGFAGQLSLGHALYVGLGAYAAAALYVHFGISPWLGLWISMAVSAAAGAVIGFLAFRFGVAGVYFAILTIAFGEFARFGFDHWRWVGGSAGFFLPVANYTRNDILSLAAATMFYYLALATTAAAFVRATRSAVAPATIGRPSARALRPPRPSASTPSATRRTLSCCPPP